MRYFIICGMLLISLLLGCPSADHKPVSLPQEPVENGIFVHISHGSDDVHRVLMGLQMAVLMAEEQKALVYFDISGVEVVLKDAPDFTFMQFPSSHTQIKKLLEMGVPILACPGCLKAAGKNPEDLMEGVQIADKNRFFNFASGKILTIDY